MAATSKYVAIIAEEIKPSLLFVCPKQYNTKKSLKKHIENVHPIKQLELFPSIIQSAATSHNPGLIANYLYDLVRIFNSFYQSSPILKSVLLDKKSFRVDLCRSVGYTIKNALGLLGIGVVDRM